MNQIKIGEIWQHYKGGLYKIIALSLDEETKERLVTYQNINSPDLCWTRKEWVFLEVLSCSEGTCFARFSKVDQLTVLKHSAKELFDPRIIKE